MGTQATRQEASLRLGLPALPLASCYLKDPHTTAHLAPSVRQKVP